MGSSVRRVFVVGSTGRLGRVIVAALAARGDELVLTGRNEAKLEALASSLRGAHGGEAPPFVAGDLAAEGAVEHLHAAVMRAVDRVDGIILAAGEFPRTPLPSVRQEDFDRALRVDATAPLLLVKAFAPDLTAAKGAVVALGDSGTTRPFGNHLAYLTAKGAMEAGLRALAVELAPDVRVNIVTLGIVADQDPEDGGLLRTRRLASRSTLGRFGTPAEVAHAAIALLDATWATGESWGIGR